MKLVLSGKAQESRAVHIHTRYLPRFPALAFVVVTIVDAILDDFHDFVSECVSFPKKINNPFWGVTVFPMKSGNFHWT